MKLVKVVSTLIALFILTPIWYFIMYRVLSAVNASELTWFLFWVYVPLSLAINLLIRLADD